MDGRHETILTAGALLFAAYFSVLVVQTVRRYLLFQRVRSTAVLTFPRPPAGTLFTLVLGITAAAVAVLNGVRNRPLVHVASIGLIALYFLAVAPLARRIVPGLYRDGVWADGGFLPYARIARFAFQETPDVVLLLLRRGGGAFRLTVPAAEYGAVRKLLEEKIRAHVLEPESVLGLT